MDKILYQNYKYIKPNLPLQSYNKLNIKPLSVNYGNKNLLERIYAKKLQHKSMQMM